MNFPASPAPVRRALSAGDQRFVHREGDPWHNVQVTVIGEDPRNFGRWRCRLEPGNYFRARGEPYSTRTFSAGELHHSPAPAQ